MKHLYIFLVLLSIYISDAFSAQHTAATHVQRLTASAIYAPRLARPLHRNSSWNSGPPKSTLTPRPPTTPPPPLPLGATPASTKTLSPGGKPVVVEQTTALSPSALAKKIALETLPTTSASLNPSIDVYGFIEVSAGIPAPTVTAGQTRAPSPSALELPATTIPSPNSADSNVDQTTQKSDKDSTRRWNG